MLNKIKKYFVRVKEYEDMKRTFDANCKLMGEIYYKSTPALVIERIMKRGIEWYDYNELNGNAKKEYYNNIQAVLKNEAFFNEINHLIADQVEYIARESKNHEDTTNIRMTINAVDLIKQRLEEIQNPDDPLPSVTSINEAI